MLAPGSNAQPQDTHIPLSHSPDSTPQSTPRAVYHVSADDARCFYATLALESAHRPEDAQAAYLALSDRHPLAAARFACLQPEGALEAWRRFRGKVNEAVAAMQCYAIALDGIYGTL